MKIMSSYKWAKIESGKYNPGPGAAYRQAVELSLKMWTVIAARGTSYNNKYKIFLGLFGNVEILDDCWLCEFFHQQMTSSEQPNYLGPARCETCPLTLKNECCFLAGSLWRRYQAAQSDLFSDEDIPARFAAARGIRDILKEELDRLNKEQPE